MKKAYKVYLIPETTGYLVYVPDFDCYTQGKDIAEALFMARDVIGLMGIDYMADGKEIPEPDTVNYVHSGDGFVNYVDVDFAEYKRKYDNRRVKKTLSIPSWLNEKAESMGINFSRTLEEALLEKCRS